jgi:hypothetical protein
MEKHSSTIHRMLLSSPSRFTGEYVSRDIVINFAFPDLFCRSRRPETGLGANPYSRNYYVLSLEFEEPPPPDGGAGPIPNYSYFGERFCAVLSILFGKRFDYVGLLISHGLFSVPDLSNHKPTIYFTAGPYNHSPRKDLEVPLLLHEARRIAPLFTDRNINRHFLDILFAAGRFYARSLQMFDVEPEFAYLDLVTCGEILANYYKFAAEELYDPEINDLFEQIRTEMHNGNKVVKRFKGSMRQIKRAFTFTLTRLLTDYFYSNAETAHPCGHLCKEDIVSRVNAAYEVRSLYVHTGVNFGQSTRPHGAILNEVQLGTPVGLGNARFEKAVALAPTFLGLERMMRYCLLRFIHLHGLIIDARLDGPPPSATVAHEDGEDQGRETP